MYKFMRECEAKNYQELHHYSVAKPQEFWTKIIETFDVLCEGEMSPACTDLGFDHYGWFPNLKLNFAENLLRFAYSDRADSIALNGLHESLEKRRFSYRMLARDVGKLADAFKLFGVKEGDVVGAWMPNIPETVTTMLA